MSANSSYHRVPEAEAEEERRGRESLETAPGEDQRLLEPLHDDDEDDEHSPSPQKKIVSGFNFSLHPTFYLRLAVLFLLNFAFSVFIATRLARINAISTIIFLAVAIFRNTYVLYDHLVSRSSPRIRIRIEIVGNPKAKKSLNSGLSQRLLPVAIDWILIGVLITTTILDGFVYAADICVWVALPLYALSTIDMGRPSRLQFASAFSLHASLPRNIPETQNTDSAQCTQDIENSLSSHPRSVAPPNGQDCSIDQRQRAGELSALLNYDNKTPAAFPTVEPVSGVLTQQTLDKATTSDTENNLDSVQPPSQS